MTKAAFARAIGMSKANMTHIENGTASEVGMDFALAAERLTGFSAIWLAQGVEPERPYPSAVLDFSEDLQTREGVAPTRPPADHGNIAAKPRRVQIVDEDSPVGEDEVEVPRLTLKLSAGSGRLNWEIDEKGSPNRFRKSWCRRKGLKPEALVTVPVAGDSMAPTIPDGASVTINTAETALRNGKPHAIDYMGEFFIKRLFRQPDGSVMVRSDNPDKTRHPDWAIPPEHGDALRILGAPVAISADLD